MKLWEVLLKIIALAVIYSWIYHVIITIEKEIEGKLTFIQTPWSIGALYLDYSALVGFGLLITYWLFASKKKE